MDYTKPIPKSAL